MISHFSQEPFEGTLHIEDADLQKMAKVLNDVNIKECPYFDLSDKYGNSARYYREDQWIPVSERLPEDLEEVIVTWVNHDPESYYAFTKNLPFTGVAVYHRGKWYWYSSICTDVLGEYGRNDNDKMDDAIEVIAWLPLPEPWKEDNNAD